AGTSLGEPVGSLYTRLSGTSMAAPHVAGAAALLAEEHPDWTAGTLKSTLVGTAAATPGTVFDRGGGRLDLATAVPDRLAAAPASLSYGLIAYPQAALPPVVRQVTLRNTGDTPLTVTVAASLRTPDGHAAPAGMLTASPGRITVPPAGQVDVTVTLAVAMSGAGAFSGEVTATVDGGPAFRVPVGVVKESTMHVLRLHALDRDGGSLVETLVTVINLGDVRASPPDPVFLRDGEGTVRVPPGFYAISSAIPTLGEGGPGPDSLIGPADLVITSVAIATIAEQPVDRDMDVVLDARAAQPISVQVQGVATVPTDLHVFLAVRDKAGNSFVLGYDTSAQDVVDGKLFVQPTTAVKHGELEVSSKWRLDTVGEGATPTYDLLLAGPAFPASLRYVLDDRAIGRLASIVDTYRSAGTQTGYREARHVFTELNPVSVAVLHTVPQATPVKRIEYLSADPDQSWFQCATLTVADAGIGDFCQAPAPYRRSAQVDHAWLRAPLRTTVAAFRTTAALQIGMNDLAEDGPQGGSIA
ncbi:MAG TPA: S8 family serine peptidase, partial [Micromonosporaceae bacterium]|nr:S8 family serine peptidase [Micromonosporaceae bacterium]